MSECVWWWGGLSGRGLDSYAEKLQGYSEWRTLFPKTGEVTAACAPAAAGIDWLVVQFFFFFWIYPESHFRPLPVTHVLYNSV